MLRYFSIVMALAFLGGCSVYHPYKDGEGYTEVPVGPNSFQVSFVRGSTIAATRNFCLTRAAELAVLHNDPYFRIVDEKVYVSYGSEYYPGTYEPGIYYRGRRGGGYYGGGWYDPGYVETYSVPEVSMRVALEQQPGENSIPAAYLIDEAVDQKLKLTDGVVERAETMPRTGAAIPPPPLPTTRPGTGPS